MNVFFKFKKLSISSSDTVVGIILFLVYLLSNTAFAVYVVIIAMLLLWWYYITVFNIIAIQNIYITLLLPSPNYILISILM